MVTHELLFVDRQEWLHNESSKLDHCSIAVLVKNRATCSWTSHSVIQLYCCSVCGIKHPASDGPPRPAP